MAEDIMSDFRIGSDIIPLTGSSGAVIPSRYPVHVCEEPQAHVHDTFSATVICYAPCFLAVH